MKCAPWLLHMKLYAGIHKQWCAVGSHFFGYWQPNLPNIWIMWWGWLWVERTDFRFLRSVRQCHVLKNGAANFSSGFWWSSSMLAVFLRRAAFCCSCLSRRRPSCPLRSSLDMFMPGGLPEHFLNLKSEWMPCYVISSVNVETVTHHSNHLWDVCRIVTASSSSSSSSF